MCVTGMKAITLSVGKLVIATCVILVSYPVNAADQGIKMAIDKSDRTSSIKVKDFELPYSRLLSQKSNRLIKENSLAHKKYFSGLLNQCPIVESKDSEEYASYRQCQADFFYSNNQAYLSVRERYKTTMEPEKIAGVYTETFMPENGVADSNKERVLINLHGGGFMGGSRTSSHLESIPIAALGRIKVISIDYRMAPEYQFPAATDDVIAVYKALLKKYQPQNIGIYGVSAGALLSAQTIARLHHEKIPLPNAVGMFAAAAHYWREGDSGHIVPAIYDFPVQNSLDNPYFSATSNDDLLAFPGSSEEILENFPASLLISATRDFSLSSVVHTHTQLSKLGVDADLYVWEGLDHGFLYHSDLQEAQEAYNVIVKYFENHLGGG